MTLAGLLLTVSTFADVATELDDMYYNDEWWMMNDDKCNNSIPTSKRVYVSNGVC